MRGEDGVGEASCRHVFGSPPHARGRHEGTIGMRISERITPACAGKTGFPFDGGHFFPDHPRMRGEDSPSLTPVAYKPGSPPHARGRLRGVYVDGRCGGITPACAGKTGDLI